VTPRGDELRTGRGGVDALAQPVAGLRASLDEITPLEPLQEARDTAAAAEIRGFARSPVVETLITPSSPTACNTFDGADRVDRGDLSPLRCC